MLDFEIIKVILILKCSFGSLGRFNMSTWKDQVKEMISAGTLSPHAVKRELVSILRLFDEDNFGDDVRASDGTRVNVTRILEWFAPAMENYCEMFDMER